MKSDEIHKLEQHMDALAREYAETHEPEIIAEMLELSRRLRELEAGKNNCTKSAFVPKE